MAWSLVWETIFHKFFFIFFIIIFFFFAFRLHLGVHEKIEWNGNE